MHSVTILELLNESKDAVWTNAFIMALNTIKCNSGWPNDNQLYGGGQAIYKKYLLAIYMFNGPTT